MQPYRICSLAWLPAVCSAQPGDGSEVELSAVKRGRRSEWKRTQPTGASGSAAPVDVLGRANGLPEQENPSCRDPF